MAMTLFLFVTPAISGEFLYYVEDGRVVITNTPSRSDVQTVPGFEERVAAAMQGTLPATPYDRTIDVLARRYSLSPDLIKAVALVESGFDPGAVSRKGAMGLMQLMPETAASLGVSNPMDPDENLSGGARYLRLLLNEFRGNVSLALAAYNAGPGAVRRSHGIPAYDETRSYVKKVTEKLGGSKRTPRFRDTVNSGTHPAISTRILPDGTLCLSN